MLLLENSDGICCLIFLFSAFGGFFVCLYDLIVALGCWSFLLLEVAVI